MIAVVPGSFDPVTYGHLDVIYRSAELYDKVLVVIAINDAKKTMFNQTERSFFIRKVLDKKYTNIEIVSCYGLLADFIFKYVPSIEKKILVKGLRTVTDYEYELQMAHLNRDLGIETSFIVTSPQFAYVSSSMVKSVAKLGGDISKYVPPLVEEAIIKKIKEADQ